jgi:hypothetical protein
MSGGIVGPRLPQAAGVGIVAPQSVGGLAPYGFWDDALNVVKDVGRTVLPIAGTAVGGYFGQPGFGGMLGRGAASLIPQELLGPYGAVPAGALNPFGFWDDALGFVKQAGRTVLPIAGQAAGSYFGQPAFGQQLGQGLAGLIPQSYVLN